MQMVLYVHRSGEGLPSHAKVIDVSQATAEVVRPAVHGAVDSFLNDIKSGWLPETADAAVEKGRADAAVKAAEQALEDAKAAQLEAEKKLAAAGGDTSAPAPAPAATTKSGPLPDDFPGVTNLRDAGITTYAKVRAVADKDELTTIPGIGQATADKIKAALA